MKNILSILALCLTLSACANLTTIGRTTKLPGDGLRGGIAIHLDAQQRLAVAKEFGAFCAEPSPDALQAVSASLGFGLAVPQQGSASLANALSQAAASIGLRTQSVQLMRDALYRVCELYYSQALNGPMVMQLHQRYQDILVALLAIEQLTGAVSAKQAVLGGTASGTGSASVGFADAELKNSVARENAKVADAQKARKDADDRHAEYNQSEEALANAKASSSTSQQDLERLTNEKNQRYQAWQAAEATASMKKAEADAATRERETIKKMQQLASASASAAATSGGQLVGGNSQRTLSDAATKEIAGAVKDIVLAAIQKDRTADACVAFLTDPRSSEVEQVPSSASEGQMERVIRFCQEVVFRSLEAKVKRGQF